MKRLLPIFLAAIFLSCISCKKENTVTNVNTPAPVGTTLVSGNFASNAHTSTGTVKVIKEATGKTYLSFENFSTSNGPDLRIWLAINTSGTSYQEVGLLTAVSGNFSYELNSTINYSTNNYVLIWCKDFSVLFGHAVLQ